MGKRRREVELERLELLGLGEKKKRVEDGYGCGLNSEHSATS